MQGSYFLFFADSATEERRGVYIASIEEPPQVPQRRLLESDGEAVFVPLPERDSGALVYLANRRVHRLPRVAPQRFDGRAGLCADAHRHRRSHQRSPRRRKWVCRRERTRDATVAVRAEGWPVARVATRDARLSPDQRWIAYVSDEAGRPEVSIRSMMAPRRYVISPGGGDQPVWHPNGRALYYVDPRGRLRKVAIQAANDELSVGPPAELKVPSIGARHANTQYDVDADGRIYFLDQQEGPSRPNEIRVVLGWTALLSRESLGR